MKKFKAFVEDKESNSKLFENMARDLGWNSSTDPKKMMQDLVHVAQVKLNPGHGDMPAYYTIGDRSIGYEGEEKQAFKAYLGIMKEKKQQQQAQQDYDDQQGAEQRQRGLDARIARQSPQRDELGRGRNDPNWSMPR